MKRLYPYNYVTSIVLLIYKFVWIIFFPFVFLYFFKRSIKEPAYRQNLGERFGFGKGSISDAIWIHAVSLGEFRASVPLVKALLQRSEKILLTTITPAGRREANRIFKPEIASGKVHLAYLPLEYDFAYNKFLKQFRPKLALVLEIELWPVMISACSRYKIPLVLAQGQYVQKSFKIDKRWPWLRAALFNGFDLILAKSLFHADRYKKFCEIPVEVMGELRFDQKISSVQLKSADQFTKQTNFKRNSRLCFCFGSTGPGENSLLIRLMNRLSSKAANLGIPKPFYIYVPRHQKDFIYIFKKLEKSGLNFVKRSEIFDNNLSLNTQLSLNFNKIDGLVGDSLGEINFYFQLADFVFIGNSFNNLGSHNVIEPLALRKPVVVGPSVWGIEFPGIEAIEAGVLKKVSNLQEFYDYWLSELLKSQKLGQQSLKLEKFHKKHSGAAKRCIRKLEQYGYLS